MNSVVANQQTALLYRSAFVKGAAIELRNTL